MLSSENDVRRYVALVALAAVASALGVVVVGHTPTGEEIIAAIFFGALGLVAHSLAHRTSASRSGSIGFLPFLSAAALTPTWASVMVVFAAVSIGEVMSPRPWLKRIFNISQFLAAESLAILCYIWLDGHSLLDARNMQALPFIKTQAVPFVAMFVCFMLANKLAVGTVIGIAGRQPLAGSIRSSLAATAVYDVLSLPMVFVFAVTYLRLGPYGSAALSLPLLGVRQLYKSNSELERINEELLQLMVAAIEARDPYTSGHSQRVARYSRVIARALGLSAKAVDRIGTAALLHDVGKIHEEFAPILRKPGRLTDSEYEVMKSHSAKGAALAGQVSTFRDLMPLIRGHHERWNGRGYPDGLAGDAIPLGARIITIADTIDAMTTVRPYRPARTMLDVEEELLKVSGAQFDPRICTAVMAADKWRDLSLEVEIAAREFPTEGPLQEVDPSTIPRHSSQFPTQNL